jgi:hypothetical protein
MDGKMDTVTRACKSLQTKLKKENRWMIKKKKEKLMLKERNGM